jgi:hypothetical protein
MHMPVGIKEHVVRLYVTVDDTLPMDVPQRTPELGDPKPDRLLGECFPRDVKPQISAAHEVNDQVPVSVSRVRGSSPGPFAYMYSMSWKLYRKLQMNGWFTCSSILLSRIILRTLSERTTSGGLKSAFFSFFRHCGVRAVSHLHLSECI